MSTAATQKITKHNFVTTFKDYVEKFVKDYNEGLFALVWALLTFGLERLLDKETFSCPRTGYQAYGIAFFVCPIIMLTLLNWLSMPAEGGYYIWSLFKRCWVPAYHRRGDFFAGFLSAISVGLVAPAAWIFLALLDAQHLVCWELGYQFGDNVTVSYLDDRGFGYLTVKRYNDKIYEAKSKSHTAAVIFLGSAVVVFCFIIILRRCCLKPFDPDERLPGLCHLEELEAFAARDELDRLLTEGDEFDQFSCRASLVQFLVIKERISSLQNETKNEKDDAKLREIQREIVEFKELERVLHFWAEWNKLNTKKDFKMILEDSEELKKARAEYESKRDKLSEKRQNRIKDAKKALEKYEVPSDESVSTADVNKVLYQSWLLTRLKQQESYFDIDELVKRWEDENVKEEIKRLTQSVASQLDDGFIDSPEVRGRIVASYIIDLYKNQNKFCLTLEQVMEKFKSIYPRAATSDPTLRYVEVHNPLYKYIINDDGQTPSGGEVRVPLLYTCVKPWEKANDDSWETFLLHNHTHSWGWQITGCLKSYCPLTPPNRRQRQSARTIATVENGQQLLLADYNNSD